MVVDLYKGMLEAYTPLGVQFMIVEMNESQTRLGKCCLRC
jgi:hypothetical protein